MTILQPPGWKRPRGYSNGVKAAGDMIFVAGQVGWDAQGRLVGKTIVEQARRALENVVGVLKAGGARPEHVVRMTWYVNDMNEYKASTKEIGEVYRSVMGRHFPAMTLFEVSRLVDDGAKVEIEATAVVPR